jgi:hypothetical protein
MSHRSIEFILRLKIATNMVLPTLLPGHHPMLNDFVVVAVAAHVAFFAYVITKFVQAQYTTGVQAKPKWQ